MNPKNCIFLCFLLLAISATALVQESPAHARPLAFAFTVNDTSDLIDDDLMDGICHTISNTCTLRAAIMQANALGGTNTINLPQGIYTLTIEGMNEDNSIAGDLDIKSNLTIDGNGKEYTIIDANHIDRAIEIFDTAQAHISNITIRNGNSNVATGGILNWGNARLTDVILESNNGAHGGGLLNMRNVNLVRALISNNTAQGNGGGIGNAGIMTVTDSIIRQNFAPVGGALFNPRPYTATLVNSTVSTNTAWSGGGISTGGHLTLTNITISGNQAAWNGGGIENGGYATLFNVTLSNNVVTHTNGIGNNIFNGYIQNSYVRIKNTIIASASGNNCHIEIGSVISLGHNLGSDATCSLIATGDISNTNPLLAPLANNGGATPTHALLPSSPAIDAGDNNGCPSADQRGMPRPFGIACDIGAFEFGSLLRLYFPFVIKATPQIP